MRLVDSSARDVKLAWRSLLRDFATLGGDQT